MITIVAATGIIHLFLTPKLGICHPILNLSRQLTLWVLEVNRDHPSISRGSLCSRTFLTLSQVLAASGVLFPSSPNHCKPYIQPQYDRRRIATPMKLLKVVMHQL